MSWDAVFFDLDDTLYSRVEALRRTLHHFVEVYVSPQSDVAASSHVDQIVEWDSAKQFEAGATNARVLLFSKIKTNYPWIAETPEELIEWYRSELYSQLKLDPSANHVLAALSDAGVEWGLITNGDLFQLKKLEALGIAIESGRVVMSEVVGWRKPDTRIFEQALTRFGLSNPDHAMMVGDNPVADIQGGRDAGMKTAWVTLGRTWEHSDYQPDIQLDSLGDLVQHL